MTLFVLVTGLTDSVAALAAPPAIPNYGAGEAVKEAQPLSRPEPREAPEPEIIEQETRPLILPKGETLMVNEFRLEGAEFIPETELQAELAPYKRRALSMVQIQEAAAKLTALYRSRGYLVARAYVPKQDARSGVLTIRIIVGKFGKFTLDNQSLVNDGLLLGNFASLQGNNAVSRADLERAMLLVDDMPGAALPKLTITRGKTFGTSDFGVGVPKDKRVQGYLQGDNLGSRFTGEYRLSGGVSLNSPLGFADQLNVRGLVSDGTGLVNGSGSYNFPLMDNGLREEISAAVTTYELGSIYDNLDATGDAFFFTSSLSYPLLRSRVESLYMSFGLAKKLLHDKVGLSGIVTSREAETGTLSLRHERWGSVFGRGSYSNVIAAFTFGNLDYNDPKQEAFNKAGVNTAGDYARLNLDFSGMVSLTPLWSLNATVSLQKALLDKNLDPIEQMYLTCSSCNGVKVFRETISSDNGFMVGTELRYSLPMWRGLKHSTGVFADTGGVYVENVGFTQVSDIQLSDIGVGYYAGWGPFNSLVQFARSIGPIPVALANQDDYRIRAQVGLTF
ncbi:ShlB/FhaC/HecB family hemolysin secretion/activation protein [Methylovulum miyakonense]|uniref:ShlB/FhaC/HecB family hemolysin secretion/activation protein n=1 Tax=Methylovulum miyakonense TaxID=645578 RepID=UPI000366FDAA|nr:POTRA domain-containing protein [Methylovulum miyakonense]